MKSLRARALEFELFIAKLFTALGASIVDEIQVGRDPGYDLRIHSESGIEALIEIKLYATLRISNSIVLQTVARLNILMNQRGVPRGIVATNARVSESVRVEALKLNVSIYDYDRIAKLVEWIPQLGAEWDQLNQEGFIYRSEPLPLPREVDLNEFEDLFTIRSYASPNVLPIAVPLGEDICRRLKGSKSGRGSPASVFEKICIEALKYLFDDDFINWTPQKRSHGNLHRFDLIARISSQNDFWMSMIADHRARYIIFEFKNYGNKITPIEVYTSERYLLPHAMRSTAIIISRKGASESAFRTMAGALRESGKIILSLDIEQVCLMLHMKDRGDDPSTVISNRMDELLVGIER